MEIPKTDERTGHFKTDCFGCVFNKTKQKTQVGCKFHDRLTLYLDKNLASLSETEEQQNYVINTICSGKRTSDWKYAKSSKAIQIKNAELEIKSRITATYILIVSNNAEMIKTALHLESLKDKPENIVFIYLNTFPDIINLMKINKKYKIMVPVDKQNVPAAIDSAVKDIKTSHYVVWHETLPTDGYFSIFQNNLIYTVDKILCWQPKKDSWEGLIVNTHVHQIYHGNINLHIFDKIKESAEYQGNTEAYRCEPLH